MHEDVDAAELLAHRVGDSRASLRRSNIRRNEFDFADILGTFARRRKHPRACPRGAPPRPPRPRLSCRRSTSRALALQFEVAAHERISSEANLSVGQHEAKVHRDRTPRKAAGEPGLENVLAAALGKFERRNGVAVFFSSWRPSNSLSLPHPRKVRPSSYTVASGAKHSVAASGVPEICNLNVTLNWVWKLNRHGSFLSFALRISIGLTASIALMKR